MLTDPWEHWDGANVEMLEEAGADNIFIFGLKAEEITDMIKKKNYYPVEYYRLFPEIRRVLDTFRDNTFCPDEQGLFQWIYHRMMNNKDPYFHLPDFFPYIQMQDQSRSGIPGPGQLDEKSDLKCGTGPENFPATGPFPIITA